MSLSQNAPQILSHKSKKLIHRRLSVATVWLAAATVDKLVNDQPPYTAMDNL